MMIGVITGDIIGSQEATNLLWLESLKEVLQQYGNTPTDWEVFRGDSFQCRLQLSEVLTAALHIKSRIKEHEGLDVRMAIGIGTEDQKEAKVSMSQGAAYLRSGKCFDDLQKRTLAVSSGNTEKDEGINLLIDIAMTHFDQWTSIEAEMVSYMLQHPTSSQKVAGNALSKSQSTINEGLQRARYADMLRIITYFQKQYK